jgi:ElaB/YqjD/DUF883 family membrane-anchored ribosome-binding protein
MFDRIAGLEGGGSPSPEQIKEKALEFASAARERVSQGGESIRTFTVKQPARALGIALGMGVLVGWLIKRR